MISERPPWFVATAVASQRGRVHIVRSWNAYLGLTTRCGQRLSMAASTEWHVTTTDRRSVMASAPVGVVDACPKCLKEES